jgi:hypothetical protein
LLSVESRAPFVLSIMCVTSGGGDGNGGGGGGGSGAGGGGDYGDHRGGW